MRLHRIDFFSGSKRERKTVLEGSGLFLNIHLKLTVYFRKFLENKLSQSRHHKTLVSIFSLHQEKIGYKNCSSSKKFRTVRLCDCNMHKIGTQVTSHSVARLKIVARYRNNYRYHFCINLRWLCKATPSIVKHM